jgi:hypothetical protein
MGHPAVLRSGVAGVGGAWSGDAREEIAAQLVEEAQAGSLPWSGPTGCCRS